MKKLKRKAGNSRGPIRQTKEGRNPLVGVRLPEPLLKRVDSWAKEQDGKPTRQEAMRRLIERGLDA